MYLFSGSLKKSKKCLILHSFSLPETNPDVSLDAFDETQNNNPIDRIDIVKFEDIFSLYINDSLEKLEKLIWFTLKRTFS